MFANFFYLIVALLITITYPAAEASNFPLSVSMALLFGSAAAFAVATRLRFRGIERRLSSGSAAQLDHAFNARLTRQFILAVGLFAFDIYGLSLPSFLSKIPVFTAAPTLAALLFMLLFIAYLSMVWASAWPAYRVLYDSNLSRRAYVFSNISFNTPILLPWFLLSAVIDLINALPFTLPKQLLATPGGQVTYFMVFLVAVAVLGPFLIQKFWRCRPLESGDQRSRIENLCRRADLKYAEILYWPIFGGNMITAGVMGLVNRFRYLLVTEGLLRFLTPSEIDAVVAHEIGHVKRRHLLFYLFFFACYLLISYASMDLIVFFLMNAAPLHLLIRWSGVHQATAVSFTFSLCTIALFLIYFRFIFGFFMRNFERQADTYVYTLFPSAQPLISTLQKIAATSAQPADKPNWHHFSITERIDFLKHCEIDRGWISRHNRKLRNSLAAFLALMLIVGTAGYQLNFGRSGERLNRHLTKRILLREIKDHPHDAGLYQMLGDLYYGDGAFKKAADAWSRSLVLEPRNPEALNNLAWLYATCRKQSLRDPARALALARRAAALKPSAHVFDTLAQSYFVNGMYAQAVGAARRALAYKPANRRYYEKQLQKFQRAAAARGQGA